MACIDVIIEDSHNNPQTFYIYIIKIDICQYKAQYKSRNLTFCFIKNYWFNSISYVNQSSESLLFKIIVWPGHISKKTKNKVIADWFDYLIIYNVSEWIVIFLTYIDLIEVNLSHPWWAHVYTHLLLNIDLRVALQAIQSHTCVIIHINNCKKKLFLNFSDCWWASSWIKLVNISFSILFE